MKKFLVYIIIILMAIMSASIYDNASLRKKLKTSENNKIALLDSVSRYKIKDSLNAATINVLMLSNKELEKYRAEDYEIIKNLKSDKSTLQGYIKNNLITKVEIKTVIKDSLVHVRDTTYNIQSFDYKSKWTDVSGYLLKDSAYLKIINRESLIISQSLVKKKFLGIKLPIWLFGYKTERIDVVSLNPNTQIDDVEFIKVSSK